MALVVVLAALAALVVVGVRMENRPWTTSGAPDGPPADARPTPIGTPAAAPAGKGGYALLNLEDDGSGLPIRWDPCRPIHYVVRTQGMPPAASGLIEESFAELSRVTGFSFVNDGTTDEAPHPHRAAMDAARYGRRWSPVLVAWTSPAEDSEITDYAGLGGPVSVGGRHPGQRRYVSGIVLLNRENLGDVGTWQAGRARIRGVILHEMGHLMGLDHVKDAHQLLYPQPTVLATDYAAGDLRGLALLSRGPCFRDY